MASFVFCCEGRDIEVFPSVRAAEDGTEVFDLNSTTYFLEDGTLLSAEADG